MNIFARTILAAVLLLGSTVMQAQVPPVPAADPKALFHDSNPKLDANKQVVYHIITELLEQGRVDLADRYLTKRYIQHNPEIPSGRDALVNFLKTVDKSPKVLEGIVAVVAQGDLVVTATAQEFPEPNDPTNRYTTTWFSMWRIQDGKVDEHWEPAMKGAPRPGL